MLGVRVSVMMGSRSTMQFLTMPALPVEALIGGLKGD